MTTRRRTYSEGDMFKRSWDYTYKLSTRQRLTLVELLVGFQDISEADLQRSMHSVMHSALSETTSASSSKRSSRAGSDAGMDKKMWLERQITQNVVTYSKRQDGRTIMDAASLNQIVRKFAKEAQGIITN